MKKISLLLLISIGLFCCKNSTETNSLSTEDKAKNKKIRNHLIIMTSELDKFINAERLNSGYKLKSDYLTKLPYIVHFIEQLKKVGFTEYNDTDYRNAFSYALRQTINDQNSWKKLTYAMTAKKYGDLTTYNTDNNEKVDSLAYFQTGVDIITSTVYSNDTDFKGIAQLQEILEKLKIEDPYRKPLDVLDPNRIINYNRYITN